MRLEEQAQQSPMDLEQRVALAAREGGLWIEASSSVGSRGRSSFLSCEPALWIRGSGSVLEISPGPSGDRGWLDQFEAADPGPGPAYERLASVMRRLRVPIPIPNPEDGRHPPTFRGGLAGCFSYDLGRRFESIPGYLPNDLAWDFLFGLYDEVLELRPDGTQQLHSLGGSPNRLLSLPSARHLDLGDLARCGITSPAEPELDEAAHRSGVEAIRELIREGDIYQANLTMRFRARYDSPSTPLATFLRLRHNNPAPHSHFQALPGVTVVSSSPECFLDLSRSGHVVSRPIKGTASRGATTTDDHLLREELERSAKDHSELAMIVDLVRNDIGRSCVPGSVDRRPEVVAEGHPSVWHLVGEVRGRLASGRDAFDLVRGSFPPGSCIGAPKLRVMEVIEALETSRRGIYTGSLGWLGLDGSAALNVVIRTLTFTEDIDHEGTGEVSFGVGGGIVFDSEPSSEWREALLKARALQVALRPGPVHLGAPNQGEPDPLIRLQFNGPHHADH